MIINIKNKITCEKISVLLIIFVIVIAPLTLILTGVASTNVDKNGVVKSYIPKEKTTVEEKDINNSVSKYPMVNFINMAIHSETLFIVIMLILIVIGLCITFLGVGY